MNNRIVRTVFPCLLALAAPLAAQQQSQQQPQQKIPVRNLGPVLATTTEPLKSAYSLRALSDGRVLVSDWTNRRIVLFDASLKSGTIVADTSAAAPFQYGNRPAALIRYFGDSTIVVDAASFSLLVLDPNGKVARVMAAPTASHAGQIASLGSAVDPQGRVIYRGPVTMPRPVPAAPGAAAQMPQPPDSGPVLRSDFDTRVVDTIGMVKIPRPIRSTQEMPGGGVRTMSFQSPLPVLDDFAVLSDGTVAFVRSQDYHVDWVAGDGARSSTPKMPFDWRRLDDDEKQKMIDSAKTAREQAYAKMEADMAAAAGKAGDAVKPVVADGAGGGRGGGGSVAVTTRMVDGPIGTLMTMGPPPPYNVVPSDLPDYLPPIRAGMLRPDLDGNLWILPTTSAQAKDGLLYDVVNRKGEIVERVQLPANRTILGFGPGVVYLGFTDESGAHVERARIARGNTTQ